MHLRRESQGWRCWCWRRWNSDGEEFLAVKLNPQIQPDLWDMVQMEDVLFLSQGFEMERVQVDEYVWNGLFKKTQSRRCLNLVLASKGNSKMNTSKYLQYYRRVWILTVVILSILVILHKSTFMCIAGMRTLPNPMKQQWVVRDSLSTNA